MSYFPTGSGIVYRDQDCRGVDNWGILDMLQSEMIIFFSCEIFHQHHCPSSHVGKCHSRRGKRTTNSFIVKVHSRKSYQNVWRHRKNRLVEVKDASSSFLHLRDSVLRKQLVSHLRGITPRNTSRLAPSYAVALIADYE